MKVKFNLIVFLFFSFSTGIIFAHCDTMDGPVVADARKALDHSNVNYALKWVMPANEKEVTDAFKLAMKVRVLNPDAKQLADQYFFETIIRLHRIGEGVAYTGIKPLGTPVNKKILAADLSIEKGDLSSLKGMIPSERKAELEQRFEKVIALKNFNVDNVKAGREYVEAYVQFFHYAEGEEEGSSEHLKHSDQH